MLCWRHGSWVVLLYECSRLTNKTKSLCSCNLLCLTWHDPGKVQYFIHPEKSQMSSKELLVNKHHAQIGDVSLRVKFQHLLGYWSWFTVICPITLLLSWYLGLTQTSHSLHTKDASTIATDLATQQAIALHSLYPCSTASLILPYFTSSPTMTGCVVVPALTPALLRRPDRLGPECNLWLWVNI